MNPETSFIFTGDIGFDKYMDQKWKDPDLLSSKVSDFLSSSKHLVINVEGPLFDAKESSLNKTGAQALIHSMNPEAAAFFNKIGADVWNICNNHIMDAGPEGMDSTLKLAEISKVKTLGAGRNLEEASKPLIFNEAGGIGLLGVGYQRACRKASENTPGCFSWSDMDLIREKITEIKKTCRWCIIVAHAGEEFTALASPYTRERYIEYLNMGADIVICHHPHVPMNFETFPGKAIFYSLGNFIFDTDYQRSQFNTEYGILLKLTLTEDNFSFLPFGLKIDREKERILSHPLPDIFEDVNEKEYELLSPLAAKMFIENTKRQLKYLKPEEFSNASEEDFYKNFYEPLRSGRVPGEILDFQLIYPLSLKAKENAWKESNLEKVKNYILKQIP